MTLVKTDSRSCFGLEWYDDEQEAIEAGARANAAGETVNGGWLHGMPCDRAREFDFEITVEDGKKQRLYAVRRKKDCSCNEGCTLYRLAEASLWKPMPERVGQDLPKPPVGYAWWSGAKYGFETPPLPGQLVEVTINGLGPGIVRAYFKEHGFLGVYVELSDPPKWWREQVARMELERPQSYADSGAQMRGCCMVFGAELGRLGDLVVLP